VTLCQRNVRKRWPFFFSSRRRHTSWPRDWSSDVCSSDLSVGRGRRMPRPDVVVAVRKYVREIRVACTQLSEHCATVLPRTDPTRSEERRVGKEGRCRWCSYQCIKNGGGNME